IELAPVPQLRRQSQVLLRLPQRRRRRLDQNAGQATPGSSPRIRSGIQPSAPSLGEAQQHLALATELRHRGEFDGAYQEYERARELFREVNRRGGAEGVAAAEGFRASNRAMIELAPRPRQQ